jgi:3-deoxy-D-manno-octulosonic-acid transferase
MSPLSVVVSSSAAVITCWKPVLRGVPVVFGPHVANFRGAAAFAQESGAGRLVHDASEDVASENAATVLANAVRDWCEMKARAARQRRTARLLLREHCGARTRVAQRVARSLQG